MSVPRLFVDCDPDDADRAALSAEGVRHLRALRLARGDRFEAIVAPGRVRVAVIERLTRGEAHVRLAEDVALDRADPEREIVLAIALADLARLDVVVEKATELGATSIRPFRAARSQIASLSASRLERWRRIARAACEQCGRTREPRIDAATGLAELLAALPEPSLRVVLHREAETRWRGATEGDTAVVLFLGPEGGLTDEENELLFRHGGRAFSLGPRVLRFETAAIAALAVAAAGVAGDHLE